MNPAGHYGLYQFNVATWRSVGASGMHPRVGGRADLPRQAALPVPRPLALAAPRSLL